MGGPRTIVVTGASRGLGLCIASTLAQTGFRVVAIARRESNLLVEAAASVRGVGSLHFVSFDLERLEDLSSLVRDIRKVHGPLYGLVNNAGIGTEGVLATMPTPAIEKLVHLNTLAPIVLTKYAVRVMMSTGAGRVVNISSIVASTGYSGLSVYAATKASLIGFTHSLAREVGSLGITVNAVAPGFVDTDMTASLDEMQRSKIARRSALRRLATADDIAAAVTFLMSDAAASITGTTLTVDAGNTA